MNPFLFTHFSSFPLRQIMSNVDNELREAMAAMNLHADNEPEEAGLMNLGQPQSGSQQSNQSIALPNSRQTPTKSSNSTLYIVGSPKLHGLTRHWYVCACPMFVCFLPWQTGPPRQMQLKAFLTLLSGHL